MFAFSWHLLRDAGRDFLEDNAMRLSAALSYYSVFSLAPLLIIAVGFAGMVFGEDAVRGQLDEQLQLYMGAKAAAAVQEIVKNTSGHNDGVLAALIGFATLFIGASGFFGQLKEALNTVWEVKARPHGGIKSFIRNRLLSFGMVLVIGFLLLISLFLSTVLAGIDQYSRDLVQIPAWAWLSINLSGSLLVSAALFAAIFVVLPDAKVPFRIVGIGAVITAVLFELGKFGLAFYLGRAGVESSYGAAGSLILVLLWVYYASVILLFGAEVTQVYARMKNVKVMPDANAVAINTCEDTIDASR